MNNFKSITKPMGYDPNLHKLGLFLPYSILATKGGKQFDFSVEVRDIIGKPDCKIGDFGNNVWYRTKAALKDNWEGYRTYSDLSRAVKNCLARRGYEILGWYEN
jgi:hypothetical protein